MKLQALIMNYNNHVSRFGSLLLAIVVCFQLAYANNAEIEANVTSVNHYGNLNLDITSAQMTEAGFEIGDVVSVEGGSLPHAIKMPYVDDMLVPGSWGVSIETFPSEKYLTVALFNSSFSDRIGGKKGDKLTIRMAEKSGFLDTYKNLHMELTNNRADYKSDAAFANFFEAKCYGLGTKKLYRSSKPMLNSNGLNRYTYSDRLAEKAGINTIIAFADSEEGWLKALKSGEYGKYSKKIYDRGGILFNRMGSDFFVPANARKVGDAIRFMAQHEPPYLVCCTYGKDRTGLISIMLQILMGATYEEIETDYMRSYANYYHFTPSNPNYTKLRTIMLDRILYIIANQGDVDATAINEMESIDVKPFFPQLQNAVEQYFLGNAGVSQQELNTLKRKLGK